MLMGFWVCEYCNSGPKVTILPAFARECPDCGQPRLDATRVFPPLTDEAMKEGIHPKYSSLTWVCKCGHKNPYPFGNCLKCGLSIDEGMNADADVDDPEKKVTEVAKKMRQSNWKCPYCGRTNRGIDKICTGCGNSERSEEDDIIRIINRNSFSKETTGPSQDRYSEQKGIQEAHREKVFKFHSDILEQGKSFLGEAISNAIKFWWCIPILFIILLLMGNIKEREFVISDMKYESTYYIEKFTTTHHTGELSYPAGAYNIEESQESRFVPDQDDDDGDNETGGNDTWGNDTWDNDTWGGDTWDNDTWGGDTWETTLGIMTLGVAMIGMIMEVIILTMSFISFKN